MQSVKVSKGILLIITGLLFNFVNFYDLSQSSSPQPFNLFFAILFIIIGILEVWEGLSYAKH